MLRAILAFTIVLIVPTHMLLAASAQEPLSASTTALASLERGRVIRAADAALLIDPITITKESSPLSRGGINDFYSNGDYWWPDPNTANGLPYIRRDGESNPGNFSFHRLAIRDLRDAVAALAAAAVLTANPQYAEKASSLLDAFFVNPTTRMNPHLQFAQAIPGVSDGRGIGIIDTIHLIEIPMAIEAIQDSPGFSPRVKLATKEWFKHYLDWMMTSANGREEAHEKNNHAVAFWLQVAVFSRFTNDLARLQEARSQFKEQFVSKQMTLDGSFPAELSRTKPYGYSIFQLDNMATLCQILSTQEENLWNFKLSDGRGMQRAFDFLVPFIEKKSDWPYRPDVQAWESLPARHSALWFAGAAYQRLEYLQLWIKLLPDSNNDEVRRNIAITQPLLWMIQAPSGR